jgi:hypothetical protein
MDAALTQTQARSSSGYFREPRANGSRSEPVKPAANVLMLADPYPSAPGPPAVTGL